jgi:hypothetical protein
VADTTTNQQTPASTNQEKQPKKQVIGSCCVQGVSRQQQIEQKQLSIL